MRGLISWHFGTKSHNEVRRLAYARHNVWDQPNAGVRTLLLGAEYR